MSANKPPLSSNGETHALKVKITLELSNLHAPGIVEFLNTLPARGETAFIRGLIYQWMSRYQGAEDFSVRLLAVLNGPGGRSMFALPNQRARPPAPLASAHRQAARKPTTTTRSTTPSAQPRGRRSKAEEFVAIAIPVPQAAADLWNRAPIQADATTVNLTNGAPGATSTAASLDQPSTSSVTTSDSESEGELNPFVNFF